MRAGRACGEAFRSNRPCGTPPRGAPERVNRFRRSNPAETVAERRAGAEFQGRARDVGSHHDSIGGGQKSVPHPGRARAHRARWLDPGAEQVRSPHSGSVDSQANRAEIPRIFTREVLSRSAVVFVPSAAGQDCEWSEPAPLFASIKPVGRFFAARFAKSAKRGSTVKYCAVNRCRGPRRPPFPQFARVSPRDAADLTSVGGEEAASIIHEA
jgi:hypothetical protein